MAKTSKGLIAIGVALVVILGWLAYGISQSQIGPGGGTTVTTGDCNTVPSISLSAVNTLDRGQTVNLSTLLARINGQYIGSFTENTNFALGDEVEILIGADDYLDKKLSTITVGCGINRVATDIYATDEMGLSIKNDAGTAVLTNNASGGSVNESAVAAGGSKSWEVEFNGKDKMSSGSLIYVVELGSEANVSSVTMSTLGGQTLERLPSVPTGLATSGSNLNRVAFRIPAFENAVRVKYNLNVALNSGRTISGAVYTTAYSEQAFVDTDGTFKVGVTDSNGAAQYEDSYGYNFYIESE